MRIPALALAALAAAAAVLTPTAAAADNFTGDVSVKEQAYIAPDGTLTMSGTYRCSEPSPARRIFIASSLVQEGKRLGFGGTEARCDGAEHSWTTSGPVGTVMNLGFHDGPAAVDARLMVMENVGGLPLPRVLAGGEKAVSLVDDRS
ncbi:DUF6299 family protein [Streptomyces sp. NPDC000410]|uniref:DUF6299 family protein n=1 Tax=Streptomyces sp. NPDC000410 TaxID=3154254 RepID=UPI00331C6B9D